MRLMGFVLLVSGAAIAFAALVLFAAAAPRLAFIFAGLAVQILGFAIIARAHRSLQLLSTRRKATR